MSSVELLFSFAQGTVIIIANHGDRIDIPANACLENKIVSGNLRIRDHWTFFLRLQISGLYIRVIIVYLWFVSLDFLGYIFKKQ